MIIEQIAEDIAAMLRADPFFGNVPVVVDDKGDVENAVKKELAAQKPLVVLLELLEGDVEFLNLGSGSVGLIPMFTVIEDVALNRAPGRPRKWATDTVEEIFAIFSPARQVPLPCVARKFKLANDTDGKLVYNVFAECTAGWNKRTT